ncbi:transmembrane protein 176A [Ctenodactylus gundi]
MSTEVETPDRGEVAPEGPQGAHINVHIHQESGTAKLLLMGCSLLKLPGPTAGTTSWTLGSSRLLVASWVTQILLGLLSGVLGGFLYICQWYKQFFSGAAFWTGTVAVLAGAAAFIYENRGGICWALLRSLLALAAFCTPVAAIIIQATDFHVFRYYVYDSACIVYSSRNRFTTDSSITLSPDEVQRQHLCVSQLNSLKALVVSLQAMLLSVWVLLLLASLAPLCLYCWRRFPPNKSPYNLNHVDIAKACY